MPQLPKNFTDTMLPLSIRLGQRSLVLRKLKDKDRDKLVTFCETHTQETMRLRYGYGSATSTGTQVESMLQGREKGGELLAVLEKEGRSNNIIAVGLYTLMADGETAEPAFVVREDRRSLGLATLLLDALIALARAQGLRCFHAQTHADNYPMLGIFIKRGGHVQAIRGTDGVDVSIPL